MKKYSSAANVWHARVTRVLSSTYFFYAILALAALQGLWYALSVRPGMYDEGTHLGFIFMYTHHLSPFISHQSPQYDYLGDTTRDASYLFYYLMSLPARFVGLFTSSQSAAIIVLRLIMIATFVLGLYVYRKVLLAVNVPKLITNAGLLIVILTPMLAPEAGVVNYDIPTFLLTAVLLLLAVRIVQSARVQLARLVALLAVGLAGCEVKFEFIAIAVPVLLFVAYDQLRKHGTRLGHLLSREARQMSRLSLAGLAVALVVSLGLFIERPVYNLVRYHGLNGVSCTKVMSEKRCLVNPINQRNLEARQDKPAGFRPVNPITYVSSIWLPTMIGTLIIVLAGVPVYFAPAVFFYTIIYGGIAVILIYLRDFLRERANQLLLFITLAYVLGLALFNYLSYASLGAAYAMNGRYLLPVLPIFVVFVLLALRKLVATTYPKTAFATLLAGIAILFTQGGGLGTAVLTIPASAYWNSAIVRSFNSDFKNVAQRVVFERNPFNEPFH
jgi:hypothetical protein